MDREDSHETPLAPAAQLHALLQPHTQVEADVSPSQPTPALAEHCTALSVFATDI